MASRAGDPFAELVDTASQIGDQLWRCGLDRALDLARGDDPDRPVRMIWHCDDRTDDLPWELVHPDLPRWAGSRAADHQRPDGPRRGGPAARAPTGRPVRR